MDRSGKAVNLMVGAGMTPVQAIRTATAGNADRLVVRGDLSGSIEPLTTAWVAIWSTLTYIRITGTVRSMKTTLIIDDSVMALLRREAARRSCTMSELVESALRLLLQSRGSRPELPPLPSFKSGGHLVDIADRDALYHAMEGR